MHEYFTAVEFIGYGGDIMFVSAYLLVSRGVLNGEGRAYNGINLVGAFLYGTYAILKSAPPVLILELIWGSIAIMAIVKTFRKRSSAEGQSEDGPS